MIYIKYIAQTFFVKSLGHRFHIEVMSGATFKPECTFFHHDNGVRLGAVGCQHHEVRTLDSQQSLHCEFCKLNSDQDDEAERRNVFLFKKPKANAK